jgi:hypothetical protein
MFNKYLPPDQPLLSECTLVLSSSKNGAFGNSNAPFCLAVVSKRYIYNNVIFVCFALTKISKHFGKNLQ